MTDAARAWVVGAGGLVGQAVVAALRDRGGDPVAVRVEWADSRRATDDLARAVAELSGWAGPAAVYWCAGAGITSTSREALESEVAVFSAFARALADAAVDRPSPIALFVASSAGGVYGGSDEPPYDEHTVPRPISPYGEAKLAIEAAALAVASPRRLLVAVGRLTNVYGPNQNPVKPQGLISVVARSIVTGQPVSIYVPLETARDYVWADDAAAIIVSLLERLRAEDETTVLKIVGSGQSVTIATILAEFKRMRPHGLHVTLGGQVEGHAVDLRVRSVVWPELDAHAHLPIDVGMRRVLDQAHERNAPEGRR